MALNRVRLSKTKRLNSVDKFGAYHPPTYITKPKGKPLPKPPPRYAPAKYVSTDLTDEFKRSAILSIPRDAIPEYLSQLTKEYGKPAVYSAVLYQYDIYKLSPSLTRDWLEAALSYLKERR